MKGEGSGGSSELDKELAARLADREKQVCEIWSRPGPSGLSGLSGIPALPTISSSSPFAPSALALATATATKSK